MRVNEKKSERKDMEKMIGEFKMEKEEWSRMLKEKCQMKES